MPAVGEANSMQPRPASVFHFAVLGGRRHNPVTPHSIRAARRQLPSPLLKMHAVAVVGRVWLL